MKILTIVVRLFCFGTILTIGGFAFGIGAAALSDKITTRRLRKVNTAPDGQHWEDVKQAFPDYASDADTPWIIAERRRIASTY